LKKACATPFLTGVSDQKELLRVVRIAEDVSFSDECLDSTEGMFLLAAPRPDLHPGEGGGNDAEVRNK